MTDTTTMQQPREQSIQSFQYFDLRQEAMTTDFCPQGLQEHMFLLLEATMIVVISYRQDLSILYPRIDPSIHPPISTHISTYTPISLYTYKPIHSFIPSVYPPTHLSISNQ